MSGPDRSHDRGTRRPLGRLRGLPPRAERLFALVAAFHGIAGWQVGLVEGATLAAACLILSVLAALLGVLAGSRPGEGGEGGDGGETGDGEEESANGETV